MKLEHQVTSLDLSKKLKELGYPQEGLWWWVFDKVWKPLLTGTPTIYKDKIVAPTVAELGERLPYEIKKDGHYYNLTLIRNRFSDFQFSWGCSYRAYLSKGYIDWFYSTCEDTEANARAKLWIYLKESKKI